MIAQPFFYVFIDAQKRAQDAPQRRTKDCRPTQQKPSQPAQQPSRSVVCDTSYWVLSVVSLLSSMHHISHIVFEFVLDFC
nr:MAG TPA: hypothetical protein [Caudoviricetes sp.]